MLESSTAKQALTRPETPLQGILGSREKEGQNNQGDGSMMQKSPWSEIITILHIPIGHGCKYNPQIGQYTQFGQHTHRQYAIYSMQYRNVMH